MRFQYYKNIIIILFVLGFIPKIYGQGNSNIDIIEIENPNTILFAPLNLLDPINPSFQLGYERMLNEKWALQVESAYIINKGLLNILLNPQESSDEYTNKGYKLRLELKRILVKKKKFNFYTSFELFYLKNKSDVINQYVVSDTSYDYTFELPNGYDDERDIIYDDYHTNDKKKHAANIKFGIKILPGSFMFEAYLGVGIAYRINKHSNRENINDKPLDDSILNDNKLGSMWIVNIPLNIKIGYVF